MKVIVQWSGGKDSQACLIWSAKKYGAHNIKAVFCNTGFEHDQTIEHVHNVCEAMKIELVVLNPSLGFEDLCINKRIFPRHNFRFCTVELKVRPFIDWVLSQEEHLLIIQGIRAGESATRAKYSAECSYFLQYPMRYRRSDILEWTKKYDASVLRPIFKWSSQQVINYILENQQRPNKLYERGAERVGCFPCIYARLNEIKLVAKDPKYSQRLLSLEAAVNKQARIKTGDISPNSVTFFIQGKIPRAYCRTNNNGTATVKEVFDYILRDEKLPSLFKDDEIETASCFSAYHGLCE